MKHAALALAALTLAALTLAACGQAQSARTQVAPAPALPLGCSAQSAHDWSAVGSQYYVIEAEAHGDDCAAAIATMRIKSVEGAVLFEHAYPVAQVPLAFNPHNTQTGLRDDLEAWIANAADPETTDLLPPWPAGAAKPPHFTPAVSRATYEAARGAQGALFCFADGAESNSCVALAGPRATLLGSLTPEAE